MVLFLDIDGVMVHTNPSKPIEQLEDNFYVFDDEAVTVLNRIISKNVIDEIIISSSHRFKFTPTEWERLFSTRKIKINKISIIAIEKGSRKENIFSWIEFRRLKPNDYIIIDDDKSLNGLPEVIKKRLILTNPYIGLKGYYFD